MVQLICKNLNIKILHHTLVSSLTFSLKQTHSIALIGPNGCGKTTLLRTLAGLTAPSQGEVTFVNEEDLDDQEERHLFLSSTPALFMDHCVLWNLEFFVQAYGLKKHQEEYFYALKRVGLKGKEKQPARTLSTGQKRRLSLAGLLLVQPKLLFADEPTTGLDIEGTQLCLDIFEELRHKNNCAFLVATHDPVLVGWCQTQIQLNSYALTRKLVRPKITEL